MKCPKCGYHSFDYLESCKKCGGDLTEHKDRFGLRVPFFQEIKKSSAVPLHPTGSSLSEEIPESPPAPTAPVDFGYDLMDDSGAGEENMAEAALDRLLGEDSAESFGTEAGEGGNDSAGDAFFGRRGCRRSGTRSFPKKRASEALQEDVPPGEALTSPAGRRGDGFEFTGADLDELGRPGGRRGCGFDFLADDPQTQEEPDFPFTQEETAPAPKPKR